MEKQIDRSKAFSSETEFQEIYARHMEGIPEATEVIKNNHREMESHFKEYIGAIE